MWTYQQPDGHLLHDGALIGIGYSGFGVGKNNPLLEDHHDLGPVPRGNWTITGVPFDSPEHGPYCLRLVPNAGTETFGRAGFLMHGDSIVLPGSASKGCVIMLHSVRIDVYSSGDKDLQVV